MCVECGCSVPNGAAVCYRCAMLTAIVGGFAVGAFVFLMVAFA